LLVGGYVLVAFSYQTLMLLLAAVYLLMMAWLATGKGARPAAADAAPPARHPAAR
jgi:hypothetical protein